MSAGLSLNSSPLFSPVSRTRKTSRYLRGSPLAASYRSRLAAQPGERVPAATRSVSGYRFTHRLRTPISADGHDPDNGQWVSEQHGCLQSITTDQLNPDQRVRGSSPWRRTITAGLGQQAVLHGAIPRNPVRQLERIESPKGQKKLRYAA
jgi:hypothetical protein